MRILIHSRGGICARRRFRYAKLTASKTVDDG